MTTENTTAVEEYVGPMQIRDAWVADLVTFRMGGTEMFSAIPVYPDKFQITLVGDNGEEVTRTVGDWEYIALAKLLHDSLRRLPVDPSTLAD